MSVMAFDSNVCHLELEVKQLVVVRPNEQAYVVESSSRKIFYFKYNKKFFKRTRDLIMLQRKERLRHARSLSMLRRISARSNVIIVATKVTLLVSSLSKTRLSCQ